MAKVRTVLGDIDANELGFTYPHEHLFAVPPANQKDRDLELSSYDNSLYELMQFKKETIQYVIAHEFCHLKYKTHGKRFYEIIEKYIPDYKKYEREIQNYEI